MKTKISQIGVLDRNDKLHTVNLKNGLNIITGKSSTGKSAIIEIFDYCFGSSDNTVPKGVITKAAAIYYTILEVKEEIIVIGRNPANHLKAFYKKQANNLTLDISSDYFDDGHFIPLESFKKLLRSDFLDIEDVDESLTAVEIRGRKSPTPSIRSFVSFMLQHQNLIANKHALFYRFDEKEKRDQLIDHTKIFIGIVTQKYFNLKQEYERLDSQSKSFKQEIERSIKIAENQKMKIQPLLSALYAAAGIDNPPITIDKILLHPQNAKELLEKFIRPEAIKPLSDANTILQIKLKNQISEKTAELRRLKLKLSSVLKSMGETDEFSNSYEKLSKYDSQLISQSSCPFCNTTHDHLNKNASELSQAIVKISNDLSHSKTMKARLEGLQINVNRDIQGVEYQILELEDQLESVEKQNSDLLNKKTLYETVLSYKVRLEILLDNISMPLDPNTVEKLNKIEKIMNGIKEELNQFSVKKELAIASQKVNDFMKEIGNLFDFEDSYKPINLQFSFETFDFYHLGEDNDKVFLRAMGSGANWLYSHLTLFLALHKYFAILGDKCAIPSILFIDQPTQVYFPSFKFDKAEEFSVENIQMLENRNTDDSKVDDDILAVENLFSQLSIYCTEVKKDAGFSPQIIITDHADNLKLADESNFESYVNGNRWRTRGFIHPVPDFNK